jgi:RNA polymerase sigma-70 factor (ECF subfamily)
MENNEQTWLESMAMGDKEAFRKIYNRYWRSIYLAAHRFLKSPELAKEVVAEVFSALWVQRSQFADIKQLRNFLTTTSRDHTYKSLRKIAAEWKATSVDTDQAPQ